MSAQSHGIANTERKSFTGVMVLIHSDDKGLVLPPRAAELQVVIVPVGLTAKTSAEDRDRLLKETDGLLAVVCQ